VNPDDIRERRIAWAMLILCPLSLLIICAMVTMGYGRGLLYHPVGYLQVTCILWAIVMTVLPILRLARIIALPLWFVALVYADMYMFVLSLCHGMYFDYSWWGDSTHAISSMVVAAIVFMALCVMDSRSPPHVTLGGKGGIAALVLIISCAFGAIWEVMEGYTEIITSFDYMSYGGIFTLFDLWADLVGAAIMMVFAWFAVGRYGTKHIASKIRMGSKSIDIG
jgi:hypothetical protein